MGYPVVSQVTREAVNVYTDWALGLKDTERNGNQQTLFAHLAKGTSYPQEINFSLH